MAAHIELRFEFSTLARRPDVMRFGRRWDTHLVVDGQDHVFQEGPVHTVPVLPGRHTVQVYFTGAGVQSIAGLLGLKYGRTSLELDAYDNHTAQLVYRGGASWILGGGHLMLRGHQPQGATSHQNGT